MKNNRLEVHKTNSTLNKKDSNLNFKQALSKKVSKKPIASTKTDKCKPLKPNKKLTTKKSKNSIKNQIKPFLTKNDIQVNSKQKKNSEKIKNLLKHAYNNNLLNNNINHFKNKSTTNLCAPTPVSGIKTITKGKKLENLDNNKSPKLNDFISDNNDINQEFNNNQNILKTNLAFLIAKNQNYDDDSIFLNINESYLDYINNIQQKEAKKRNDINNNIDRNKNEYLSDDYSIKNNNLDNNDTNSLINSIININKYLTNEVNHKAVNNTNNIGENKNKKTKPRKVYENQLLKQTYSNDLIKPKEESENTNNENDKNANNIIITNINDDVDDNYQRELINKVLKSKFSYTSKKPLKAQLLKKRKFLNLGETDEDKNYINNIFYFNTHSPKTTINNTIIKSLQFSPNISNINKSLFINDKNINKSSNQNKNKSKERIKVSIAKKYQTSSDKTNKNSINSKNNKNGKETLYENSTKSNNTTNSVKTNKTKSNKSYNNKSNSNKNKNMVNNNINKINEFNLINENVNNLLTNNKENKNINFNIFDDDFYSNTVESNNNNKKEKEILRKESQTQLNKYISYIDNFSTKKNNKKKSNHNSSCHFIYPSLKNNKKKNSVLNFERNNISNLELINNDFKYTQDDDDNRIQEIKIKLKNPSNVNSSVSFDNKKVIKINNSNPNINVVNVQNSTINICKNKYNIITSKSNENLNDINFENNKNKNRAISSVIRNKKNKNKTFIYSSSSKSPSYRHNFNKKDKYENNEENNLNNSNDKIVNQNIYIKQVFSNSKYKTQNNFVKLKKKNYKNIINGKNIQELLNTEYNKTNHSNNRYNNKNIPNIKMNPLINNYNTPELEYYLENNNENNNENIYISSNNDENNNIFENKNFYTSNSFFHYPLNRSNNNIDLKNSSPKIYVKPSKYIYRKNNLVNKLANYSPSKSPNTEISFPSNNNIFCSQKEEKLPGIITYRKHNDLNNKKENYVSDIEFINDNNIDNKINNNLLFKDINKTKIKAYVKKNKNINYNKKNNIRIIKSKIAITNNLRITKYYNYFFSNKQIIKSPCYISKQLKKPKFLPLCKRSFMTKIIFKYIKRIKNDICYIEKKVIKNKNIANIIENKENNNIIKEENIIKANILDFSLEQNKESIYNNYNNMNYHYKNKNYFNHNKDYQESIGEINLSFSNDDINTFKCKENTIEAVFNELNNINTLNNDSEIKVTFGQENINNNNYNNSEFSTEGRIINDSFNNLKKRKFSKIPCKIYKEEENLANLKKSEKISSVIIYDNEEENEDIKINFEENKEIDSDKNDDLILDIKNNEEENNVELLNNKNDDDDINLNMDNMEQKNKIDSKDIINFAEKLGNIFGKKSNSNDNKQKNDIFNNINIYTSNFNIYENKDYKTQILNNEDEDFINILEPKCRTYSTNTNKYYEILSHYDLTALNKLEFRMNNEKNEFKHIMNNNNSINELDSENENNVTFSQNKNNQSQELIISKDINQNKIEIEKEITYLLNIISINNFNDITNKLLEIITNKNDINNENNYIENKYILADTIIRKSTSELKYSFLYAILCQNLNEKDFGEENNEKKFKNIINISLKKKFEENLTNKNYSNKEFKEKMIGIINIIIGLINSKLNNVESGFDYLNILYDNYLNDSNKDNKYLFLESIFILLDKFGKIIYIRKDLKNIQELNNFIDEKIKILFENENTLNFPEYIFNEITNIINTRENEWKFNIYEENQFNKYKKLILNINDSNLEKNNSTEILDINNKIEKSNGLTDYYHLNNLNYEILLIMKKNLINNSPNDTEEGLYNNLYINYKISIFEIIQYYIEICIDLVDNISIIDNCNNYINKIIEQYSAKEDKDKNENNNRIVDLILNIDYIIMDNQNMHQIMGYLLYSLINYELYKIEDLNKFIGKEETTLINIAIIIKYIIIYCNKDYMGEDYKTKILNEFKQTELFKSNSKLFDKYVINDILL